MVVEAVMYFDEVDQNQRLRLVGITKDEINETLETRAVLVHAKADDSGLELPTFDYATGFANINHNDGLIITFGEVRFSEQEID